MSEDRLGGRKPILSGKVRDLYEVAPDRLLFVASDRISAFDHVLGSLVPDKGKVLTQLSLFWFDFLRNVVPNHLITADVRDYPADLLLPRDELRGRSMIVQKAKMVQVECVARGYLSGSAWREYAQSGTLAGEKLPAGLKESGIIETPIFSPATKAESGHDENITVGRMREILGADVTAELERLTRIVYTNGRDLALANGIIIADTKFEFGLDANGTLTLAPRRGPWSIGLYGRNLFDRRYDLTRNFFLGGIDIAAPGRPASYGVRASYAF